jgi:hypothetical protein
VRAPTEDRGTPVPTMYRLAVVVAAEPNAAAVPSMADCRRFVETSPDSVLSFWRENADDWFGFTSVDYYGPVTVTDVPAKAGRGDVMDRAIAALGRPLGPHDLVLVLLAPSPSATFESGAAGHRALVPTNASHTFACHEFGHIVGLNHTCGIPNTGGDWIDNGRPDYFPWYGDPYDLMSGMTFGNATPTTWLPATSAVSGFPSAQAAGPRLARAMLHFTAPSAIPDRRVRHVHENQGDIIPLVPAGSADGVSLVVWHPANEDERGRGRVYVEYRQPFDDILATRWDLGLAKSGAERDRRGVIVHVTKDVPGADFTAVWYAGRIIVQSPDEDVEVDTGRGRAVVEILHGPEQDPVGPRTVRVRVTRASRPYVRLEESVDDQVTVTTIGSALMPGFEFMGPFDRERHEVIRTVTYVPKAFGLGGAGPYDEPTSVQIRWYLQGQMLTDNGGSAVRVPPGLGRAVTLGYEIDSQSAVLRLWNQDIDDTFLLDLQCWAGVGGGRDPSSASVWTTYSVDGSTVRWGDAAERFLDYWNRITNPIPKPKVLPWQLDLGRHEAVQLEHAWRDLYSVSPQAAQAVRQIHVNKLRHLSNRTPIM